MRSRIGREGFVTAAAAAAPAEMQREGQRHIIDREDTNEHGEERGRHVGGMARIIAPRRPPSVPPTRASASEGSACGSDRRSHSPEHEPAQHQEDHRVRDRRKPRDVQVDRHDVPVRRKTREEMIIRLGVGGGEPKALQSSMTDAIPPPQPSGSAPDLIQQERPAKTRTSGSPRHRRACDHRTAGSRSFTRALLASRPSVASTAVAATIQSNAAR